MTLTKVTKEQSMEGKFDILLTQIKKYELYKVDINCNGHKYTGEVRSIK